MSAQGHGEAESALGERGALLGFAFDEVEHKVEKGGVKGEGANHENGVNHGVAIYHIEKDIVGRAVPSHEEHIVVVNQHVCKIGGNREAAENGEDNGQIFALHRMYKQKIQYLHGSILHQIPVKEYNAKLFDVRK